MAGCRYVISRSGWVVLGCLVADIVQAQGVHSDVAANSCELYVSGYGEHKATSGSFGENRWRELWIQVAKSLNGERLGVGVFETGPGCPDGKRSTFLAKPYDSLRESGEPGFVSYYLEIPLPCGEQAFFADVRREDGSTVRYWQSQNGRNFSLRDLWTPQPVEQSRHVGAGVVIFYRWANDAAAVYNQRRVCRKF